MSLDKFKRKCGEQGLAGATRWALREACGRIVRTRRCDVLTRPLDRPYPRMRGRIECEYLMLSAESGQANERLHASWPAQRRLFQRRFSRGQSCVACFQGDRGVGYIWITEIPERDDNLGLTIRPQTDETYGFDLWVLPEHRPDLIGQELITRWLDESLARGRPRAIGVVDERNKPMQITTRLVFGFRTLQRINSLEFFGRWGIITSRTVVR